MVLGLTRCYVRCYVCLALRKVKIFHRQIEGDHFPHKNHIGMERIQYIFYTARNRNAFMWLKNYFCPQWTKFKFESFIPWELLLFQTEFYPQVLEKKQGLDEDDCRHPKAWLCSSFVLCPYCSGTKAKKDVKCFVQSYIAKDKPWVWTSVNDTIPSFWKLLLWDHMFQDADCLTVFHLQDFINLFLLIYPLYGEQRK